ncbi:MAG: outer membrane lipid asymmetry maintenance protein MlaD [Planctomycetota bacterium]
MKKFYIEVTAGVFVLVGLLCVGYLSLRLDIGANLGGDVYEVTATFSNIASLREGASVVIAGVPVGSVEDIKLENYAAEVTLEVRGDVKLPEDTMASIKTRGMIGEQYVGLSPGGSMDDIEPGGRIRETEPAIDLHSLISKYAFGDIE